MLETGETIMIQIMRKQGYSKKSIARELKISINTVRRCLKEGAEREYKARAKKESILKPYYPYIQTRISGAQEERIPATVLLKELQEQGYSGQITILKEYLRSQKPKVEEERVRFETLPGKQMQVDWAEFRGSRQRLSAFIATLGYSRMSYVEYVEDEQLETLLYCHEHAFDYFGGVPQEILYDNMKTVILSRDYYGEGKHRLQSGFWDFSKHYNFLPKVCRPYRAQTKGKVERFIHYLKHSFHYPLKAKLSQAGLLLDKDTANYEVRKWLQETANCRIHGTTGIPPIARLIAERALLQPLAPAYSGQVVKQRLSQNSKALWNSEQGAETTIQHALATYEALLGGEGV